MFFQDRDTLLLKCLVQGLHIIIVFQGGNQERIQDRLWWRILVESFHGLTLMELLRGISLREVQGVFTSFGFLLIYGLKVGLVICQRISLNSFP